MNLLTDRLLIRSLQAEDAAEDETDPADTLHPFFEQASGRVIGNCGFIRKQRS